MVGGGGGGGGREGADGENFGIDGGIVGIIVVSVGVEKVVVENEV